MGLMGELQIHFQTLNESNESIEISKICSNKCVLR